MLNNNMLHDLNRSYEKLDKFTRMQSTGRKVSRPSDDPVVAVRGMHYRNQLNEIAQFRRNADTAISWMETTDTIMGEATQTLQRVRELMVQAANGTYEETSRKAIADEIAQLRDHLGDLSNATIGGRYLFAGTETNIAPYDKTTQRFIGENTEDVELELGQGIYLPVNVKGKAVFSNPSKDEGVFGLLENVVNTLRDPNQADQVGTFLNEVDEQMEVFLTERASLGARINRIELIQSRLESGQINTKKLLSSEEDADMAWVITELKAQENVHRAALATGSRIIQPSLVDFLR